MSTNIAQEKTKRELKTKISDLRSYRVVKANALIQKTRYSLSAQAQKCVLYIISKIRPDDSELKELDFSIVEFCQVCGLDKSNGANYRYIKQTLKELRDKSFWMELETGTETTVAWIDKITISEKSGVVKLKIDDTLKPYLLHLQEKFTQYELVYTLAMKSQYSIRLYELLKSYEWKSGFEINIDELKKMLLAEKYDRFPDFKRYVLDIALREIATYTDISVTYEIKKLGRRYDSLLFYVKTKSDLTERLLTWENLNQNLTPEEKQKKAAAAAGKEP